MSLDDPKPPAARGRVWDAPVRLTHWLLVACIAIAWLTRDARLADLHAAAGYGALVLVAFRVAWGFAGTRFARFADFRYSPREAWGYLRAARAGVPRHYTGHNPAGSWAVYSLLAFVALTCLAGILAIGGMHALGPLPGALGPAAADLALRVHDVLAWILLAIIAAHVLGAVWSSLVHRENLVGAMLSGRKLLHGAAQAVAPRRGVALALAGVLTLVTGSYLYASGWADDYREARARAAAAKPDTVWSRECGSCHLAYPAALLPERSWVRMLDEQASHFGEDLSLAEATLRELRRASAPAPGASWAAWKLAGSAAPHEAPQRITELAAWREAHAELPESAFRPPVAVGRHDCEACHADAASGIFGPRMIQRPTRRIMF
jgi:cytochrome b/cytochrome c5